LAGNSKQHPALSPTRPRQRFSSITSAPSNGLHVRLTTRRSGLRRGAFQVIRVNLKIIRDNPAPRSNFD
jgi:hypothetical protein